VSKRILTIVALLATMVSAQDRQSFTGVITDSVCATGDHSGMRMGSNDAECTMACIEDHGAAFLLFDGKNGYMLSDQKLPEKFAGKRVVVTGTLNAAKKTITVETIALAH
jgi:hypothetical protein